jgi:hypothetical protein
MYVGAACKELEGLRILSRKAICRGMQQSCVIGGARVGGEIRTIQHKWSGRPLRSWMVNSALDAGRACSERRTGRRAQFWRVGGGLGMARGAAEK